MTSTTATAACTNGTALRAVAYVRALWWVLRLVSDRGSIRYAVVSGVLRDDALTDPEHSTLSVLRAQIGGGRSAITQPPASLDSTDIDR